MSARLLALAFANFAIGTGYLLVSGALPKIAASTGVSLCAAGQLAALALFAASPKRRTATTL
jgi:predicted MFS family arabinose efflux permease